MGTELVDETSENLHSLMQLSARETISGCILLHCGPGSSVVIVTELLAGRSVDRIPVGARFFHTCLNRPWGPHSLLYNGYRVFPGGKERPGRNADPLSPSSAVGHETVELYLYSPFGPYGLYRASVPGQG